MIISDRDESNIVCEDIDVIRRRNSYSDLELREMVPSVERLKPREPRAIPFVGGSKGHKVAPSP